MVTRLETQYPLILTSDGVAPALKNLCVHYARTTPGSESPPDEGEGDVLAWIRWTQKHFIRPAHLDHQDLKHLAPHPHHRAFMPYFEALGLTRAVYPARSAYDSAAIHGGTPWDTWERMTHLVAAMRSGLSLQKVFYINGERLLMTSEFDDNEYAFPPFLSEGRASIALPTGRPLRQNEMAQFFWQTLMQDLSSKMALSFVTLNAAAGHTATSPKRFNTVDTVRAMFDEDSSDHSLLFVSNAPYGPYQDASVRFVLKERGLQKIADSTSPSLMRDVTTLPFLDTIARLLYTEYTRQQI